MALTNIQWCARHTVHPEGQCKRDATGAARCLDVECTRCWAKGYSANLWEGCTPVSAACKNCWAEAVAHRQGHDVWGVDKPRLLTGDGVFKNILRWNKKARLTGQRRGVFWQDMGDLFEDRPELAGRRMAAFAAMGQSPDLDHMLLTKRPENVLRMVPKEWRRGNWPSWVWMGATIEDGQTAFARFPHIMAWSDVGALTFVSAEPLLGNILAVGAKISGVLDLVIIGGESGAGARPLDLAAAQQLTDDATDCGAMVFMKQLGSRWAQANGGHLVKGASHGQDPYRWPEWARRREMPEVET